MDVYQISFGATRLITPGFETYGYVYVAQFLQEVAPLFVFHLGEALYRDVASADAESVNEGSQDKAVN